MWHLGAVPNGAQLVCSVYSEERYVSHQYSYSKVWQWVFLKSRS